MRPASQIISAAYLAAALMAGAGPARAEDGKTYDITIKGKAFQPAEIHVSAGKPFIIRLKNENDAPVEFEGKELKVEKVAAGKSEIVVRVRGLKAGRYLFVDEYQEDVAKGFVVAE